MWWLCAGGGGLAVFAAVEQQEKYEQWRASIAHLPVADQGAMIAAREQREQQQREEAAARSKAFLDGLPPL